MGELLLVTPTYAPDLDLCRRLVDSVRAFVAADVEHLVLPDARDVPAFTALQGGQVTVAAKEDFLPPGYHRLPGMNRWTHARLPRPVGGWLMQQLVKLSLARQVGARALLFVDSDVTFVRPVCSETFVQQSVRFYRLPDGITTQLPAHHLWSTAAATLLGVPVLAPPQPDYISQLVCWDAHEARAMLDRIESRGSRRWDLQVARTRRVSEYLLYGTWIDRVAPRGPAWVSSSSLCHSYWSEMPLTVAAADAFVRAFPPDHVAVGMQSISGTAAAVRASVVRELSGGVLT